MNLTFLIKVKKIHLYFKDVSIFNSVYRPHIDRYIPATPNFSEYFIFYRIPASVI